MPFAAAIHGASWPLIVRVAVIFFNFVILLITLWTNNILTVPFTVHFAFRAAKKEIGARAAMPQADEPGGSHADREGNGRSGC
jgi:hypothetical protein